MTHWIGVPPPETHPMRHWSVMSHWGFARQFAAWAQHLLAMQSPHADPSDGHVGGPQTPPKHWPPQHCAPDVHMPPFGWHAGVQVPAVHDWEQHSEKATQEPPFGVQGGPASTTIGPQTLPLHSPLQQLAAVMQGAPLGSQGPPSGTIPPQMPPLQSLRQHGSMVPPQGDP